MTSFQKRLKSYVWGYKAVERHWFLKSDAPKLLRHPSTGEQVTTKRALYAAFVGDIPEGKDLRPGCGVSGCSSPHHQRLEDSRSGTARALHFPDLDGVGFDDRPNRLPKGMTMALVAKVQELGRRGNSLSAICAATQLGRSEVMKIRGGAYDRAVATLRRSVEARTVKKVRKDQEEPGAVQGEEYESAGVPSPEPIDESDSEAVAWLRTVQ